MRRLMGWEIRNEYYQQLTQQQLTEWKREASKQVQNEYCDMVQVLFLLHLECMGSCIDIKRSSQIDR